MGNINIAHWWMVFGVLAFLVFFLVQFVRVRRTEAHRFYVKQNRWFKSPRLYQLLWWISSILLVVAASMLLFAAMGISFISTKSEISDENKSILFVVDVSPSMAIRDIGTNTRLNEVKQQISVLLKSKVGAQVAILLFAESLSLYIPFSNDYNNMIYLLDKIQVGSLGDSTAISDALLYGDFLLSQTKSASKNLVLITDGIQNSSTASRDILEKHAFASSISLWKIGTVKSGFLKYTDPKTNKVIRGIVESTNSDWLENFSKVLQKSKGGHSFVHIQNVSQMQDEILQFVAQRGEDYTLRNVVVSRDISNYFLFMFLICFMLFIVFRVVVMRNIQ